MSKITLEELIVLKKRNKPICLPVHFDSPFGIWYDAIDDLINLMNGTQKVVYARQQIKKVASCWRMPSIVDNWLITGEGNEDEIERICDAKDHQLSNNYDGALVARAIGFVLISSNIWKNMVFQLVDDINSFQVGMITDAIELLINGEQHG